VVKDIKIVKQREMSSKTKVRSNRDILNINRDSSIMMRRRRRRRSRRGNK
jgi:hypothetical protein